VNSFLQDKNQPSQILFAFDDIISPDTNGLRWAVAYSTRKGCDLLVKRIIEQIGKSRWDRMHKAFVTSLDFGLTEPAAIEYLANQTLSQVRIANSYLRTRPGFRPERAFHPKIYLFDRPGIISYVVGSANLTSSALTSNTEVVLAGEEIPGNFEFNRLWAEVFQAAEPLTDEILTEYKNIWRAPRPRRVTADTTPTEPEIETSGIPVLGDEIARGALHPQDYSHLWVEAGSMSSGGSHNQLELPRGANRFFGFNFTNYGDNHVTIGYPVLSKKNNSWDNRPLTWHGNNRMERINLPTRAQGGYEDYSHTAVLFRRMANSFELVVFPWDGDPAIAWRRASNELRNVYRLGERGPRICGLF
jgi:HKD family nuclease